MTERRRILIAGCGYVGSHLATMLVEDGHGVSALRRGAGAPLPGVETLQADLTSPQVAQVLPASIDSVVYTAGPSAPDEDGYRRAYVIGLRNLLEALAALPDPPRRILFTSSTAVYGQSDGAWVDEESPTRPRRFSGRVLLEAEELVRRAPIAGAVIRLGGIYGPGRDRGIEQVRSGAARLRPGPPHYTNRIHRDDAAGALRHLLDTEPLAPVYLGVDGHPAEEGEVLRFLATTLGLPEPATYRDDEPLPPRRSGSKRCRNDRLLASGYRFRYPSFRAGFTELIRED